MSRPTGIVLLCVLALGPACAMGGDAPIDAVLASPDRFRILLENAHVRVLEYTLQPGDRDQWHTHPAKVSYVVDGGELRIHLADGTSLLSTEVEGKAAWMDPLPRHYAENVGKSPVKIVLIEVKDELGGAKAP